MHLSYSKKFKLPMYEASLVELLLHNMTNGNTNDEKIYSVRILLNLSFNSEIKAKNYKKLAPHVSTMLFTEEKDVML